MLSVANRSAEANAAIDRFRFVPADQSAHQVPIPPTPLVGRAQEVAEVAALLGDDVRLLTLTGPGGVGKTRLALQVARDLQARFADGVVFVDLAPIRDPDLVIPAVTWALGVRDGGDRPLLSTVLELLRDRRLLLILDNFEQVVAAAPVVAELLAGAARLAILTTSRTPLRLRAEHEFPVAPLPLPARDQSPFADLAANAAVALFVQRARAVDPRFALTRENGLTIAEICTRLDGLPLAIELAAVRTGVFPPAALLSRLERRLPLLTGGRRDQPTRHRTMRQAVAWSHDLLDAEEQALFRRLAVFAGGFDLEAAEAVAGGWGDAGLDVLDGVASLVDASLLRREEGPLGAPRYAMLETVREFGLEALAGDDEETTARDRHAAYMLALAERAEPELFRAEQGRWLTVLEVERDNLRTALDWLASRGELTRGLRLASALTWFWIISGRLGEGRGWLEHALAAGRDADVPVAVRAKALASLGWLAHYQADHDVAVPRLEEALALWRSVGDRAGVAQAIFALGAVAEYLGDEDAVTTRHEEALALFHEIGDIVGVAWTLENLADAAYRRGDNARAAILAAEALTAAREAGDTRRVTIALAGVAQVACELGDLAGAVEVLRECLELSRLGGHRLGLAEGLAGFARVAVAAGRFGQAAGWLGSATAIREAVGVARLFHHEQYRRAVAATRAGLDERAFAAAWDAGTTRPIEEAVAEALAFEPAVTPLAPAAPSLPPVDFGLTTRELEVLRLVAAGRTDKEIGEALFISHRTAMRHVANIYNKLGVGSRAAAVSLAHRHALI